MPENQDTPGPTPQAPPSSPIVMSTPIHDQIADHLGVRQKHRRQD
ncbi:hypothetical protein [Lentzea indica]|jgi:hypothetical protein|nr:hypothetical protein [Lentzea indica]